MRSLASPRWAGPGQVWHAEVRRSVRAHNVRVNSPQKSGPKPHRFAASFCRLFLLRLCLICFDRDRPNRLHDAITLDISSL
jgi:hypothetical protein